MQPGDLPAIVPLFPEWYDEAACTGVETDAFFPEVGGTKAITREFCDECPVREECLQYALDNHMHGIWGGTSTAERRAMRRRAAAA